MDAQVPIAEWKSAGDLRARITLDDLLRMSPSAFDEGMSSSCSDVMRMLLDVGDTAMLASAKIWSLPPGTRWQYSSGARNILGCGVEYAVPGARVRR